MYVVDKGYVLLVEPLLQAKADPGVRAPDGATALFMAAAHGHSEIIEPLMKAGADPTIKGPKGKTATEVAQARYGEMEAAFEKGEPPAVIALLAGKTWEEAVEDATFASARSQAKRKRYPLLTATSPAGRQAANVTHVRRWSWCRRAGSRWAICPATLAATKSRCMT